MAKKYNDYVFMQWFYDLVTMKKIVVLMVVVAISMFTVALTGFYFNSKAADSATIIYENNLQPVRYINLARIDLNANRTNLFHAISEIGLNQSAVKQFVDAIPPREKQFDENLTKVEEKMKELNDEFSLKNIEEIKADMQKYRAGRKVIIKHILKGERQQALKVADQYRDVASNAVKHITEVASHIQKRADKRSDQVQADETKSVVIMALVFILSLSLSSWLGWVTADRIAGILGGLGEKMTAVADGDLTTENMGRPEGSCIGDLCVVFDTMLNNLKSLVREVAASADEIGKGSEELSNASEQTAEGANQISESITQLAGGAQRVSTNVGELSKGSQQASTSITQLAEGTSEVSSNVELGASNLNKINKAIQKVSSDAGVVAKLGNKTEENANEGRGHVQNAIEKIGSIKTVSGEISVTISELGKLSSEIEQIVDLIKNISGQTNLLALNAAIEAARAGEHGKGFAVVADEVKKLASQSGEATDKITGMIKEIQEKTEVAVSTMDKASLEVEEGVVVVNDAGQALSEIIEQVKEANLKIQHITKDIDDVAVNSEDVVKMIENISAITEQTAASANEVSGIIQQNAASSEEISSITEETSASAEEISSTVEEQTANLEEINANAAALSKIAEALNEQVSKFKL